MTNPGAQRASNQYQLSITDGQQDAGPRDLPAQEAQTVLEQATGQGLDAGIRPNLRPPQMTVKLPVMIQPPASRLVPQKPFYSIQDAALLTGLEAPLVLDWIARGLIPARLVGDEVRLLARPLDAYRPLARAMEAVARLNFDQDEVIEYLRRTRRRPPWAHAD